MRFSKANRATALSLGILFSGFSVFGQGKDKSFQWSLNGAEIDRICNFEAVKAGRTVAWKITPDTSTVLAGADGSQLILTGSGSLGGSDQANQSGQNQSDDDGIGKWQTLDANNKIIGSGVFRVSGFVKLDKKKEKWQPLTATIVADHLGNVTSEPTGLKFLRVEYSDGTQGVLAVAALSPGTPKSIFVGAAISKGLADYWQQSPCNPPSLGQFPATQ
jgi:hypothetical protein